MVAKMTMLTCVRRRSTAWTRHRSKLSSCVEAKWVALPVSAAVAESENKRGGQSTHANLQEVSPCRSGLLVRCTFSPCLHPTS